MNENFSARLQIALRRSRKSQTEIAAETRITSAYLSDLKHGKRSNPSPDKISALAEALGVSLSWLLAGVGEMDPVDLHEKTECVSDPKENPPSDQFPEVGKMIREAGGLGADAETKDLLRRIADALETIARRLPLPLPEMSSADHGREANRKAAS